MDDKLLKATKQNPVFLKVKLFYNDYETHKKTACWCGLVACVGHKKITINYEDEYSSVNQVCPLFMALEDGNQLVDPSPFNGSHMIKSSYTMWCRTEFYEIKEFFESTQNMLDLYHWVLNNISITVSFCDYSEELDKYGMAKKIEGSERIIKNIEGIHNILDGEKWMLENYPAQYMGCCITCSNGNFHATAVPCPEYGKGNYETISARKRYAKKRAEQIRQIQLTERKNNEI